MSTEEVIRVKSSPTINKFGGSCLTRPEDFHRVLHIIQKQLQSPNEQKSIINVVSALNGVTDLLIEVTKLASEGQIHQVFTIMNQIESKHFSFVEELFLDNLKELNKAKNEIQYLLRQLSSVLEEVEEFGIIPYFIDYVMSFGEKLCALLLHLFLTKENFNSSLFYGEDLIITNDEFNNAIPDLHYIEKRMSDKLLPLLDKPQENQIVCFTGFIGRNKIGYTTTLGRGGSDFSATILGRVLFDLGYFSAGKIILWKDVAGILTGNPKIIENPTLIHQINYREAKEISILGAKILHPKCVAIIEDQKIPVEIRNFNEPDNLKYSIISQDTSKVAIKGIEIMPERLLVILESPFLLRSAKFASQFDDFLAQNAIQVLISIESLSKNRKSIIIDEPDFSTFNELFYVHTKTPKEWLQITGEKIGGLTIISERRYQASILMHLGKILFDLKIDFLSISQDPSGISTSIFVQPKFVKKIANALNCITFE